MSNQQVNQSVPKHDDGLQADQFDENILVFDNIFSRGYGFSPQVLTRLPQLSIEAKGLYSYFSSFAGQRRCLPIDPDDPEGNEHQQEPLLQVP
mgnify:CR=1 FL=1